MTREELLLDRVVLVNDELCWKSTGKPIALQRDREGYLKFTVCPLGARRPVFYYAAHRAVWFLHFGQWPTHQIDHINRDRSDNRVENLRDVPAHVNAANTERSNGPISGVHRKHSGWRATLTVRGERHNLGQFATQEEALSARARAVAKMGIQA